MLRRRACFAFVAAGISAAAVLAQPHSKSFVIVLIGPTGSGKTTQIEFLKRNYNIPTITADNLIKENPSALAKYRALGIDAGTPQTSPALNDLIRDRLSQMDVRQGVALDGYPATKEQADYLAVLVQKMSLPSPVVIQIDIPDDVARRRLQGRKRDDDTPELIERRLKDYHRELDMIRAYYPEANIWTIDGTRPAADVSKTIQGILNDELPKKP